MNSVNYQNLLGFALKEIHQEQQQTPKSYRGKIKIYVNDAKPERLL